LKHVRFPQRRYANHDGCHSAVEDNIQLNSVERKSVWRGWNAH
jgi:hypothetical protein